VLCAENIAKFGKFRSEPFRGVIPVMKLDFHFAISPRNKISQRFNAGPVVFLLRIEERVLRMRTVRIAKIIHRTGISLRPVPNSIARTGMLRLALLSGAEGLEMIGHAEHEVFRTGHVLRPSPDGGEVAK
jgi:hypothetical protein